MEYSFSIVIPVYNADKYIAEMIDSVVEQKYNNWNLVLIDDGSTDKSGNICDGYINKKIQVFHKSNQGQIAARIDGIMRATGDYTLVLDADDKLHEDCLLRINQILNIKPYDAVMFPYQFCDEFLNPLGKTSSIPINSGELNREEILEWIIHSHSHGLVDKVVKTDLIKKGAIETPRKKLKINGDYALIIPIMSQVNCAYFTNEIMYSYRVFNNSISHNYIFQQVLDTDYVSQEVEKYLQKKGLYNSTLKKYVNIAYLKMIIMITEGLVKKGTYDSNEYKELWNSSFYLNSKMYETVENLGVKRYIELILLRYHFYFLKPTIHLFQYIIDKRDRMVRSTNLRRID